MSRGIPARELFEVFDVLNEMTDDAQHTCKVLCRPGRIDTTIRDHYAPLTPQDQHDVTLFLEVAASRGVWFADLAMRDVHAWNLEHPSNDWHEWYVQADPATWEAR